MQVSTQQWTNLIDYSHYQVSIMYSEYVLFYQLPGFYMFNNFDCKS